MKRKITAGIVTLALAALMVPAAFAAADDTTTPNTQVQEFHQQMFDWHKTWLDDAVKNKRITEDQAQAWSRHFDQMKEFHSQYGMGMMGGGVCNGPGTGPGMMGNFR